MGFYGFAVVGGDDSVVSIGGGGGGDCCAMYALLHWDKTSDLLLPLQTLKATQLCRRSYTTEFYSDFCGVGTIYMNAMGPNYTASYITFRAV